MKTVATVSGTVTTMIRKPNSGIGVRNTRVSRISIWTGTRIGIDLRVRTTPHERPPAIWIFVEFEDRLPPAYGRVDWHSLPSPIATAKGLDYRRR